MAGWKVNWSRRFVMLRGVKYCWERPSDDERHHFKDYRPQAYWTKKSKKTVICADGHARPIADLDEEDIKTSEPYWIPVKNVELVKELEEIAGTAYQRRKKRLKAQRRAERRKAAKRELQARAEHQERSLNDEGSRKRSTVDFRLKSALNDFELCFRVAPSKKHEGLFNFSVHRGQKFLGFVETEYGPVLELGNRLRSLKPLKKRSDDD